MSRRARTRRDKRAPQPDFDDDTAAYGRFSFIENQQRLYQRGSDFGHASISISASPAWASAFAATSARAAAH